MPIRSAVREPRPARRARGLVLESTRYDASIRGLLAEVVVTQRYRNPMREPIEAVFNLPTPTDATFLGLRVTLDGHEHVGVVQPKAEAARRYEVAIEDGDGAVLLENPEPGQYVVNVGNLKPGTEARVVLRYALWLSPTGDEVRLRLPTVLAPRYGTPLVAPHQRHATDLGTRHAFDFRAIVEGPLALARVVCPSHGLVLQQGQGGIGLRCEGAEMDRDLVLVFEGAELGSATHVPADGESAAAVMTVRLPSPARPLRPADVLFLIDASGSMQGDSISQAAVALVEIAAALPHADRFQLMMFGNSVRTLHDSWCPVTDGSRKDLCRMARRLQADLGGTELVSALEACLLRFASPAQRRLAEQEPPREKVLFIVSDGQVDDRSLPAVADRLRAAGVRVYAVAVGAAPVRKTFEPLCEATGGAIEEAFPGEGMAAKVVRHFRRIGGPRWSVAGVEWRSSLQWQVLPDRGHAGDTLRLSAGLASRPENAPRVTLRDDEGHQVTLAPAVATVPGDLVPRMAGREQWAVETDRSQRLAIALRHGLLTPETSCIVVSEREAGQHTDGQPRLVAIPQALPAGWGGVGMAASVSHASHALHDQSHDSAIRHTDSICEYSVPDDAFAHSRPTGSSEPDAASDADSLADVSVWLDLAAAYLDMDPALRAQLRTALIPEEDLLALLPEAWREEIVDFARKHQFPVEGLVVALLCELFRMEARKGSSRHFNHEVQAALDAALAAWPVPAEHLAELMKALQNPAPTV